MKSDNFNKQVSSKIIDLLVESRNCSFSIAAISNSMYQITTYSYPLIQNDLQFIFEKKTVQDFSISLIEYAEGCYPILREKWNFEYDPNQEPELSEKSQYIETVIKLRSLAILMKTIDKENYSNLRLQVNESSTEDVSWDSLLQKKDIKYFPKSPMVFLNNSGRLSVNVEYTDVNLKPRIINQILGSRPRLISLDVGDEIKDIFRLNYSLGSTETSPQDLNHTRRGDKLLSLIASESFFEENEIGFKLISSELHNDQDSGDENFGRSSFDMDIDEIESDNTEDASISLYIQQCKSIQNLSIFSNLKGDCNKLIRFWRDKALMQ